MSSTTKIVKNSVKSISRNKNRYHEFFFFKNSLNCLALFFKSFFTSSSHELGFGGSSGPGCGGGDFWAELAQFGIYPSNSSSGSANARSIFSSSISGIYIGCCIPNDMEILK